jgi:hypothetical protein
MHAHYALIRHSQQRFMHPAARGHNLVNSRGDATPKAAGAPRALAAISGREEAGLNV